MLRQTKTRLVIGMFVTLSLMSFFMAFRGENEQKTSGGKVASQDESVGKEASKAGVLRFMAMGDMLAHDSIVAQAKTGDSYDFTPYFKYIRPTYKDADVVFCNPETVSVAPELGRSGYPTFNAPKEFADGLVKGAGCNLINLATNHMYDKHQEGVNANVELWGKQSVLAFAGANRSAEEQRRVRYFTKNGLKVAFVAFADYSNDPSVTPYGVNMYKDKALFTAQLQEARAKADAVILSMHWGTEDSNQVNPDQEQAAQLAADLGADVIIGTGPHVLQKVTWLNGKNGRKTLVWYSIGNMLSSQLKPEELTGVIASFTVQKAKNNLRVSDIRALPTYMSYSWPVPDKAAEKLEARTDFKLRPLAQAGSTPTDMFGSSYSVNERTQYVVNVLGNTTGIQVVK